MSESAHEGRVEPAPTWSKSWPRDYFESILIAVIFALFIRTFIAQAFKIPSKSMEDGLLVGDHIIVNKFAYAPHAPAMAGWLPYGDPQPGQVMVFKYPRNPERDFIKRVIARGGDTIELVDGRVIRNGREVEEPYVVLKGASDLALRFPDLHRRRQLYFAPTKVPTGQFFVMGDNRLNSEDSRFWGTVPPENVKGRALLIYWSFDVPERFHEAEQDPAAHPGERAALLRYTVLHFFDKSRWLRSFRPVR